MPPSLRDVVWRRVRSLGDDATEVLTAASVLGVEFYEDVLIDMMAEHSATVVRDALDTAERNGLLLDSGSVRRSLQFVHALVANALYADVGTSRPRAPARPRRRRAGAEGRRAPGRRRGAARAALRRWPDRPAEAREWSIRAGDHALEHLAPTEAAQHYRVALDLAVALDRPESERSRSPRPARRRPAPRR